MGLWGTKAITFYRDRLGMILRKFKNNQIMNQKAKAKELANFKILTKKLKEKILNQKGKFENINKKIVFLKLK